MRDTQFIPLMWEVKPIVESNGNGKSENPEINVTFEPLTQDTWVERDEVTGRREIAFSEDVRDALGIEEDEEFQSN